MPQMKPFYWLMMLLFIYMYMISIISLSYFNMMSMYLVNKNVILNNSWVWKW